MVPGRPDPIPLEHVHVEVTAVDLAARVTLRQHFRNTEAVPLEVVYVFPLDEAAAVCGFTARVDGICYDGVVKERDEAFKEYDDAMEAGHGGYLLDEERADVLTVSLGNVKPGSEVDLEITYVTELASEGQAVRFTLPTTVSPRYAPAEDQAGVGPTPADTLNPPVQLEVPYRFTFEMDVTMSGTIRGIESPSHPIAIDLDGTRARVRLAQREAAMDGDLVIVIAAQGLDVPHATVERGSKGEAAMVSFVPSFAAAGEGTGNGAGTASAEVVFVIDRSGSMGGDSIAEVRNALQLCLRSLRSGCTFNIVSFGNAFSTLFPESRPYTDASLAEAAAFVATVDADMGGTEILPALEHVVSQPVAAGVARQVVLLTDGEVSNTDAVIAMAARHKGTTRFFTWCGALPAPAAARPSSSRRASGSSRK
jgi:Ca-activated chloride channel family protein